MNILLFSRTAGMHAGPSLEKGSDTDTSGNPVAGRRKTRQHFMLRQRVIAAAALSCILFVPSRSNSVPRSNQDERVLPELSALGKRGDMIARAREQVLEILQQGNACTVWFQESDHDPAEVFRSLHFELDRSGPAHIYSMRTREGSQLFKHPWAARSMQYAGRGSTIQLNANGPFFNATSQVMQLDPGGVFARPSGNRLLTISNYNGDTREAQITILLHELGHIVGRLPEDDGSWDGRSARNTSEVSRHCKAETIAAAHNSSRGGNKASEFQRRSDSGGSRSDPGAAGLEPVGRQPR
jgi:hypothetical protein